MMNLWNWSELLREESIQLEQQGIRPEELEPGEFAPGVTEAELERRCRALYDRLDGLRMREDYPYREPSDFEAIRQESEWSVPSVQTSPNRERLHDQVLGAWLARSAGCLLGKPVEGWPRDAIRRVLSENGAYPLSDFFTHRYKPQDVEDWMREEFEQNAIEFCRAMPRDDDMDYTILALKTLEIFGPDFTTERIASMWLTYLPPFMTYTAERAAYLNLCAGIPIPETAVYLNPYREWIGAQIRTDFYGYINPGNPGRAAEMAFRDAALSHTGNGIYGAMWIAAMNAAAFSGDDPETVIRSGLAHIPKQSRLHEAIEWTLDLFKAEKDWERAGDRLHEKFAQYHRVHTINNAAIVAMALLYGGLDLERTITIAVMMGLDTDCNGASAGSIVGIIRGASGLPDKWVKPLHDQIESYIAGEGVQHISKLAMRTMKFI